MSQGKRAMPQYFNRANSLIVPPKCVGNWLYILLEYGSIFIEMFMLGSERRKYLETEYLITVQGHPRSLFS